MPQVAEIFSHERQGCTYSTQSISRLLIPQWNSKQEKITIKHNFLHIISLHFKQTDSHETFLINVSFYQIRPMLVQVNVKNNACNMMIHTGYITILERLRSVMSDQQYLRCNTGLSCVCVFPYHWDQKEQPYTEMSNVTNKLKGKSQSMHFLKILLVSFRGCCYKGYIQGHLREKVTSQKDQHVFSLLSPTVFCQPWTQEHALTHQGQVMHICISEQGQHWFK